MECGRFPLIPWLLDGDVSIQYQTRRDLLDSPGSLLEQLRSLIALEGWGSRYLCERDPLTGLWCNAIYSPKWVSTHYTLLELKNLGIDPAEPRYVQSAGVLLSSLWSEHGSINKSIRNRRLDLCVGAMLLGMTCYARIQSPRVHEIVDYILDKQFPDGGFNCRWDKGAVCSSLHTTIAVLEAFRDYRQSGYTYRLEEIVLSIPAAWEFILRKRLYRSVRTGMVIDEKMLMLSYPSRWKYDILRCMDYFASVQVPYDSRMEEALDLIWRKRRNSGCWPVQHKHSGRVYFDPEPTGGDSRMNTLRVLRVLKTYRPELYNNLMQDS